MKTTSKLDTELENTVYLLSTEDAEKQFGEAIASSISTDQVITWAKFILTDDRPNENRQRVPAEEFDNIIRTGIFKPVKMAMGGIKDGHEDSRPLGVITNLIKEGNKIVALAALWNHERDEDVALIKDMVHGGKPVNVSWEILYGNSRMVNGVSDLLDTILKAATIVGIPAYAGRTQLLAVAATKWSPAYIKKLPDTSFLYINDGVRYFAYRDDAGVVDPRRLPDILKEIDQTPIAVDVQNKLKKEVSAMNFFVDSNASIQDLLSYGEDLQTEDYKLDTKELEGKVSELETKLGLANDTLVAKEKELADALALAETANTTVKTLTEELTPLREFKAEADKGVAKAEKLSAIKAKFEGLKLDKPAEYFDENTDKLLAMDEASLDFMLQEMVAFKDTEGKGEGKASTKKTQVPNLPGESGAMSISDIAAALRERNKK
jgi:hypothetical protein